jgi:6-phosphogluconolactonase/glucosamine-6-phosphate isomerase/deaminase
VYYVVMKFFRIEDLEEGVEPLRDRLMKELADGRQVLWLLTGGSSMSLSVAVMAQIPDELTANLTCMLSDERYGKVGHKDSNAAQLDNTGFLPKQARLIPVLRQGLSFEETAKQFGADFHEAVSSADIVIAQFGMGADGHIAGIKPGSPAVESADLACAYEWSDYQRITLTPKALQQVTAAYVFTFGADRLSALRTLRDESPRISRQPAQILKHVPEAYVYNDQIGDSDQKGDIIE